mmetsp:Transcript_10121/g.15913  ORF Transcript_10121/g.15913 Transcript_10121/m.15913 type:complete len:91 (-) Transcript_10121:294-566(-)
MLQYISLLCWSHQWSFFHFLLETDEALLLLLLGGVRPELVTLRCARPSSTERARSAKFRLQKVSSPLKATGEMHTNISVFESPDNESWSR